MPFFLFTNSYTPVSASHCFASICLVALNISHMVYGLKTDCGVTWAISIAALLLPCVIKETSQRSFVQISHSDLFWLCNNSGLIWCIETDHQELFAAWSEEVSSFLWLTQPPAPLNLNSTFLKQLKVVLRPGLDSIYTTLNQPQSPETTNHFSH